MNTNPSFFRMLTAIGMLTAVSALGCDRAEHERRLSSMIDVISQAVATSIVMRDVDNTGELRRDWFRAIALQLKVAESTLEANAKVLREKAKTRAEHDAISRLIQATRRTRETLVDPFGDLVSVSTFTDERVMTMHDALAEIALTLRKFE